MALAHKGVLLSLVTLEEREKVERRKQVYVELYLSKDADTRRHEARMQLQKWKRRYGTDDLFLSNDGIKFLK